ncbi:SIMPL domain-containing protein [Janibacter sp. GXQ6167]|uniref:SIMPL domain-containing protein n=1 Tax=Janibacter sp. GXQ6167 TaxID=3240791 RepID=UPI00352574FD
MSVRDYRLAVRHRHSWRSVVWAGAVFIPWIMVIVMPVRNADDAEVFYMAAPALLAFAFGLAGSHMGSVLDDWRKSGRAHTPWIQLLLSLGLTGVAVALHFTLLDRFQSIPRDVLREHSLPDLTFNAWSWFVFLGAWLAPVLIALVSPELMRDPHRATEPTDHPPRRGRVAPGHDYPSGMRITVQGTHEKALPAERGTIHVTVSHEADTADEAMATTQALAADLTSELDRLSGSGEVSEFSVGAFGTRSWRPTNDQGELLPLRHRAQVGARATFGDFTALGRAATGWAATDGVEVDHIAWELSDATRARQEVEGVAAAIERATTRAQAMADALGRGPVTCVEVADPGLLDGTGGGPTAMYARSAWDSGEGLDLRPEEITVEVTVQAVFEA